VGRRAAALSCISSYFVKRALKDIRSCPMPLVEGVTFYLTYLMSSALDINVREYLANLLESVRAEDALAALREYGDLTVDHEYRVVLRSGSLGNLSEALGLIVSKSVKLKEDVKARAAMGKYVAKAFVDAGISEENPNAFKHALEVAPKVLAELCKDTAG